MTRIVYDVHEGRPSWHQQRAGHISAAATVGFLTLDAAEAFEAKRKAHHPDILTFILARRETIPPADASGATHE